MFGKNKIFILISLLLLFVNTRYSYAEIKDTDFDGISDEAEINQYKTDPNNPDTDKDGVLDYQEVLDKTDPNDINSSIVKEAEKNAQTLISPRDPIPWYIARISGILAFVMLSIVVCFGLLMSSKFLFKFKFITAPNAIETHSFIALISLFVIILHFSSLFFDNAMRLSPVEALIPLKFTREFTSVMGFEFKYAISLGIVAFYLAIVLVITSFYRGKIVSTRIWRSIHYSTFLMYCLFLVHGFISGTDSKEIWMRAIYVISMSLVSILILIRIFGKKYFYPSQKKVSSQPTVSDKI